MWRCHPGSNAGGGGSRGWVIQGDGNVEDVGQRVTNVDIEDGKLVLVGSAFYLLGLFSFLIYAKVSCLGTQSFIVNLNLDYLHQEPAAATASVFTLRLEKLACKTQADKSECSF